VKNQTIVIAYDGSPNAEKAANFALQFATISGARLLLVFVVPPYVPEADFPPPNVVEIIETEREAAELTLKEIQTKLEGKGVEIGTQVLLGNPADELVRFSQNPEVGMVAVGKTGKGAIARLLLGSVAEALVRKCPKPLVLVP
jgi:nucleotide-binding universal stress UspA family protein